MSENFRGDVFTHAVVSVDARLDVNVALNRPAYQTSTYVTNGAGFVALAKYANDGSHATSLVGGRCALTETETNPWWGVDLGVALYVAAVNFTNRNKQGTYAVITSVLLMQNKKSLSSIVHY